MLSANLGIDRPVFVCLCVCVTFCLVNEHNGSVKTSQELLDSLISSYLVEDIRYGANCLYWPMANNLFGDLTRAVSP